VSSARGIAEMVRGVLADADLDPEVRALAVERIEARLALRARAHRGEARELAVTLGEDGVARVTDGGVALDDPALASRLALDLVASLAPAMGAARHDVKNGVRAARRPAPAAPAPAAPAPEAPAPAPEAPSLHALTLRLVRVVALQQSRIAALEAALGEGRSADGARADIMTELREVEACLSRAYGARSVD
jgi:hypothetical protein